VVYARLLPNGGDRMKVRVPVMIQDPLTSRFKGMRLQEGFYIDREEFFLDGPVTRRVAILDFDPDTGAQQSAVRFVPAPKGRKLGRYGIANEVDIYAPDFIQASVFGTVIKTMYMFEEADTLGRQLVWAFDAPQLFIVPRAGELANAYYERDSHSVQFFCFKAGGGAGPKVYTALSRDIVAHETGHAILDGIAPSLYNATTPQSLALHEAVADLTAALMGFFSHTLKRTVLEQTGGSITYSTAFSSVAEEFGRAIDPAGRAGYLRSLLNRKTLDDVPRNEPHALSEVLSGALYAVMVKIHESLKRQLAEETGRSEYVVSFRALGAGAKRFKSIAFRALDYLPPGEVTFADYGRAILAADQAAFPDAGQERQWIREEFVRRRIVPDEDALKVRTNFEHDALKDVDLETLVNSEWAAYEFANRNRDLLGAPLDVPLWVRPRLDVTKRYYFHDGPRDIREVLFKVSWDRYEPSGLSRPFPRRRQITVGSTLAIDWETRKVRARLVSEHDDRVMEDRDSMLRRLVDAGVLVPDRLALAPDGKRLRTAVRAEMMNDDLMRVRGTARLLHILEAL